MTLPWFTYGMIDSPRDGDSKEGAVDSYCAAVFAGHAAGGLATLCAAAGIVMLCRRPVGPDSRASMTLWTVVIVAIACSIGVAQLLSKCGP